ncbi:DUF2937 family protein [Parvularcula sp. ZS-1/3]|uniref:DUF2937 family protein n=1 Tax=Parvularcula mediterranea TaxID=2732508 RepID=A0A7Y3W5M2_9PROT|nr:DUF2937 family protein [Parvularcula mediterranea]NNU16910.1 DUF2937 family protein [Parvularcula mediterranea]
MSRIIAFIFGLLGAVGASQAPEFTQQYMQNLTGRVDELIRVVERFDEDAANSDMSRQEALDYCLADERPAGAMSCRGRADDIATYERRRQQLMALQDAGEWQRPIFLARNFDQEVFDSTRETYKPAVPTTMVGGGYALAGFAGLWGVISLILGIITAPFRRY